MWPFNRNKPEKVPSQKIVTLFKDLGAPFPLFEASAVQASEFRGPGKCSLCGKRADACFELGIGCAIMIPCPSCQVENGLDASDREQQDCRNCKTVIPFPPFPEEEITTCFSCLRNGRAAITKDTEIGMVSWEQAFEGMTNGRPGLKHPDFELVPTESDWIRARLPKEMMFELLRTPTYSTIQGESWQFCCKQPMVFLGEWTREDFNRKAIDGNGEAFFRSVVQDVIPGLWEDELHDETGIYVFRCQKCARLTAHWDLA